MKKQISILKAIKGKPSVALTHMVKGLLKQSRRKKFKIYMGTFGKQSRELCFGCAATCTIQNISKINFIPDSSICSIDGRSAKMKMDYRELDVFEIAIDSARSGDLVPLFRFCSLSEINARKFNNEIDLYTYNWKENLPAVRKVISELKKAGY